MAKVRDKVRESQLAQGHNNTGGLYDSYTIEVEEQTGQVIGRLYSADHAQYVEFGVSANRIPFGDSKKGAAGGTSLYIQALIGFWEDKGLSGRDATGAAFATAHKHKREGMPTRASSRFSKTGNRLGYIRTAIEESEPEFIDFIESNFGVTLELAFMQQLDFGHVKAA